MDGHDGVPGPRVMPSAVKEQKLEIVSAQTLTRCAMVKNVQEKRKRQQNVQRESVD